MTMKLREDQPHLVEIMQKAPPLKRIGNRNDLTAAFVYLLSDASSYTTGYDHRRTFMRVEQSGRLEPHTGLIPLWIEAIPKLRFS